MSSFFPRIISLLPSATEIVCALGLESNLVGITHECDFPVTVADLTHVTSSRISHQKLTSAEIDHAVRSQLDGHGSIYDLDQEKLRKLKPDVIITQELCEVCAVTYKTVEKAAKICASAAEIISLEPNTIEDIFENILTVGKVCGVGERALKLVEALKKRIETVKEVSKTASVKPRVFMLEWLEPPFAPGHWTPEQVEIAGGICLLSKSGAKSVTTTYQAIIESNPDVMVFIPCGYYVEGIVRQLKNTYFPPAFRNITAFVEGSLWAMDASAYFSRPAPRVVDGIEILAQIFHPELFGNPAKTSAVRIERELINFAM